MGILMLKEDIAVNLAGLPWKKRVLAGNAG
jgi:hypothetical protein